VGAVTRIRNVFENEVDPPFVLRVVEWLTTFVAVEDSCFFCHPFELEDDGPVAVLVKLLVSAELCVVAIGVEYVGWPAACVTRTRHPREVGTKATAVKDDRIDVR